MVSKENSSFILGRCENASKYSGSGEWLFLEDLVPELGSGDYSGY